jgi:DNA (cytosine-5)-methyltransferase 1
MGTRKRFNVLSLFTGAGGLDLGFELSGGFTTRVAVEYQPEFAATLRLNKERGLFPDMRILQGDVRTLDAKEVAASGFPSGQVDLMIGGPPCESFSVRGKRKGSDDARGMLTVEYASWVHDVMPRAFVMENVPRLAKIDGGTFLRKIIRGWEQLGYNVAVEVLRASAYGAATDRQRLIVIGMLETVPSHPSPTHGSVLGLFEDFLLPLNTARTAFAGLPAPNERIEEFPTHHVVVHHTAPIVQRFSMLAEGQQDDIRQRTRLRWDSPAPSLMAGTIRSTRSHIHPSQPRELTNRECARLHGFPDDYLFAGSSTAVCKQIANSVPVPLARGIAEQLYNLLSHSIPLSLAHGEKL